MRALRLLAVPIVAAFVFISAAAPASAQFTIDFTVGQPPPPIPSYTVLPVQNPNYIWQPGYWAWGPGGYYWVPGTWVAPPQTGYLWTPGYWGYNNGGYGWNPGYWATQVGFYGGINYGPAYPGTGFYGGQWGPGGFSYNTAVWPVNTTVIHNTYINRTVINRTVINRTSYNGGRGGIQMHPDAHQLEVEHIHHIDATTEQREHAQEAARDRNTYSHVNSGKPEMRTAPKPLSHQNPMPTHRPVSQEDKAAANAQVQHKAPPAQHPQSKPPSGQNSNKKPPVR
jgi:hypothetical protein